MMTKKMELSHKEPYPSTELSHFLKDIVNELRDSNRTMDSHVGISSGSRFIQEKVSTSSCIIITNPSVYESCHFIYMYVSNLHLYNKLQIQLNSNSF